MGSVSEMGAVFALVPELGGVGQGRAPHSHFSSVRPCGPHVDVLDLTCFCFDLHKRFFSFLQYLATFSELQQYFAVDLQVTQENMHGVLSKKACLGFS